MTTITYQQMNDLAGGGLTEQQMDGIAQYFGYTIAPAEPPEAMAKMTQPGKWRFSTSPQPNGCPIIGSDGMMVAMLAHSVNQPEQRDEALGNAATEAFRAGQSRDAGLLEALKGMVAIQDAMDREGACDGSFIEPRVTAARAAIAAVKGAGR